MWRAGNGVFIVYHLRIGKHWNNCINLNLLFINWTLLRYCLFSYPPFISDNFIFRTKCKEMWLEDRSVLCVSVTWVIYIIYIYNIYQSIYHYINKFISNISYQSIYINWYILVYIDTGLSWMNNVQLWK